MIKVNHTHFLLIALPAFLFLQCSFNSSSDTLSHKHEYVNNKTKYKDHPLLDTVQLQTFNYMWEGAEPISGAAPERIHMDDIYPQHKKSIVTSGGTGFGIMAIIVGIRRNFISRSQGFNRIDKIAKWLEKAERHHGAWSHWMNPDGNTIPFSKHDDGGDLVETAFLAQGLITARQYFRSGNLAEQKLAKRLNKLWESIEWSWYTRGENVLYWHWSPNYDWKMNFAVRGYNECTIMYILGIASPTFGINPEAFHEGYMRNGEIITDRTLYDIPTILDHYDTADDPVGPLFWAHYSFLGLNPQGLKDQYADYWNLNVNHAKIHHAHCSINPYSYKGYSENCWGLTSSYSMKGYYTHKPTADLGVITPTAALSSMPYTPYESIQFLEHLYNNHRNLIGEYGPYDAFSLQSNWHLPRYLAIDQLPISVMIENYRSGLLWELFMSAPEIQKAIDHIGMTYEKIEEL